MEADSCGVIYRRLTP